MGCRNSASAGGGYCVGGEQNSTSRDTRKAGIFPVINSKNSYYLELSEGDLAFAVSPLLTTSTRPLSDTMGHPLLKATAYRESLEHSAALGQPKEKRLPALSLCHEPCTEMNLAEVHVVNLAQIFSVVQEIMTQELFICSGY